MIVLAGMLFIGSCSDETFNYDGPAQVAFARTAYSAKVNTEVNIPVQLIASGPMADLSIGVSIVTGDGTTVTGVTVPATVTIPAGKFTTMLTFNTGANTGDLTLQLSCSAAKVSGTLGTTKITITP